MDRRIQPIEIQDESLIVEPPSPYSLEMDILKCPQGWEARVILNGAKLRCHHTDRRALVLALNKICIERIRKTTPPQDLEMVLKAYEDFILQEETQYYLNSKKSVKLKSNPTLN